MVDLATGALLVDRAEVPTTVGHRRAAPVWTPRSRLARAGATGECVRVLVGRRRAAAGRGRLRVAGHRGGRAPGRAVRRRAGGARGGRPADRRGRSPALRAARPDVVLLVGGTDGGDGAVLLHNAAPAGDVPAAGAGGGGRQRRGARRGGRAADRAGRAGDRRRDNVLPRIGVLDPGPARAAIREVFLRHVIGGKRLSRGPRFASLVRAATPDAVLTGVELLADLTGAGTCWSSTSAAPPPTSTRRWCRTPEAERRPAAGRGRDAVAGPDRRGRPRRGRWARPAWSPRRPRREAAGAGHLRRAAVGERTDRELAADGGGDRAAPARPRARSPGPAAAPGAAGGTCGTCAGGRLRRGAAARRRGRRCWTRCWPTPPAAGRAANGRVGGRQPVRAGRRRPARRRLSGTRRAPW